MESLKIAILLFVLLILHGCGAPQNVYVKDSGISSGRVKHARRFTLEEKDSLTILTIINPWQGAEKVNQKYLLVKRGERIPPGYDTSMVVRVPVERIIAMSTTYLSMISALGETGRVAGISGGDLLYDENMSELVKEGKIDDVGYDDNLNKELIINLRPDLVMVYGIGGESSGLVRKLKELNVKVMFNADYLEDDPLGKAEWIKVFGALFSREDVAVKLFTDIEASYDSVRSLVAGKAASHPRVLLGLPWKDTWYISPGNSYISRLITDAGGEYLWKDTFSETSMPYGLEYVWMKAADADYWLNISTVTSASEILTIDNRLGELRPFRNGNLYNNNKRVSVKGGLDYWESGTVNPQIILKDIASILHPGLFPGYECFYYRKIK